jgi:hypothetical protein
MFNPSGRLLVLLRAPGFVLATAHRVTRSRRQQQLSRWLDVDFRSIPDRIFTEWRKGLQIDGDNGAARGVEGFGRADIR